MKYLAPLLSACMLLLFSCQSDPPEITGITWKLELAEVSGTSKPEQYLQLILEVIEPQGFSDLASLDIFGPRDAQWSAELDNVVYRETEGTYTLVPGRLAPMAGEQGFSAGSYRVVIEDIPGNRHEREFFIPRHTAFYEAEAELPEVHDHVLMHLQGEAHLILYDAQGRVLDTRKLEFPQGEEELPLRPLLDVRNLSSYRIVLIHPVLPVISTTVPIPR